MMLLIQVALILRSKRERFIHRYHDPGARFYEKLAVLLFKTYRKIFNEAKRIFGKNLKTSVSNDSTFSILHEMLSRRVSSNIPIWIEDRDRSNVPSKLRVCANAHCCHGLRAQKIGAAHKKKIHLELKIE
ncbi:unnamed protein product [Clavelina lepadiformis]|uniref:Uncharacterized protein n=1 Tax=Clavelina lepadiformis TaxID=159417 RepID=A0ABP0G2D3_CLALP